MQHSNSYETISDNQIPIDVTARAQQYPLYNRLVQIRSKFELDQTTGTPPLEALEVCKGKIVKMYGEKQLLQYPASGGHNIS